MGNRDYDLDILTRTILGEAGGEDAYGQAMVGSVIMNRSRDSRWGGSVADVALAPSQFSTWNKGAGGNDPTKWDAGSAEYKRTRRIAEGIYDGKIEDRTEGATHYYSPSGMDHLDQGYDVPKWAEAENARRENGSLTYGGHIFTGRSEGGSLSVSTKGASDMQGVPPNEPILMTGIGGGPADPAYHQFNVKSGVQDKSVPWNQLPEQKEDWYFEGGSGGGHGRSGGGNNASSSSESDDPYSNDNVEMSDPAKEKGWLTKDRSQMLLAIGAGLLSGEDWASGIGAASENLMGVNQNIESRDIRAGERGQDRQDRITENRTAQADRMAQIEASNRGSAASRPVHMGNVAMKDGSMRADLFSADGKIVDSTGQDVSSLIDHKVNNSDASGSKAQMTYTQAAEEKSFLTNTASTLQTMDRVSATIADQRYGAAGAAQNVSAFVKTLLGRGLSQEQIDKAVAKGDMQGLIGQTREQTVGPGVMTEQDAFRIMEALGGDLSSISANPEVIVERLGIMRGNLEKDYNQRYEMYQNHLENFPQLDYGAVEGYTPWEAPEDKGALDSSNVQKFPKPSDWTNEEWATLTDEEKASLSK